MCGEKKAAVFSSFRFYCYNSDTGNDDKLIEEFFNYVGKMLMLLNGKNNSYVNAHNCIKAGVNSSQKGKMADGTS